MELKILNYSDNKYFYSGSFFEKPFLRNKSLQQNKLIRTRFLMG